MQDRPKPALLFVCLGNICRSPLAEAAFRHLAHRKRLDAEADSAGTGDWHTGEPPDKRAQAIALSKGIDISSYRARQIDQVDFERFTHIFALDHDNLAKIRSLAPAGSTAEVTLLLDAVEGRKGDAVTDPYFGDASSFEKTWADVSAAAEALVRKFSGL